MAFTISSTLPTRDLCGAGPLVRVLNVMLGLRMYVSIINAFSVTLSGVTVQPNMTSNGGGSSRLLLPRLVTAVA